MSAADARRLLLLGQGLLAEPEGPVPPARLLATVESLGFVQVDSINVLERAHHLTLHSRLLGYRQETLRALLESDRSLFEQWTHDASIIPVRWYAHWHPRFRAAAERIRANAWWRERMGPRPERVLRSVLDRVAIEGPLQSRDFDAGRSRTEPGPVGATGKGWWNWSRSKSALEYLWRTGALAIARREGFEKVYDLAPRVHVEHRTTREPDRDDHVAWACRTALARVGAATPRELAAFWHAIPLAEARSWCDCAVRRGEIEPVRIDGADGPREAFAIAGWRDLVDQAPDAPAHARLLSPFDPVIRDRQRALRLFGFDYRFEAFVPAARRRHGYYVLPVLEGDRFVARLSARHDRAMRTLRVEGVWWEPRSRPTRVRQAALDEALERLATFVGAVRVERPRGA